MQHYLVEAFVGGATVLECAARARLAEAAALEAEREGATVRIIDWLLVPEDEICFYLFSANKRDDVARVSDHAGLGHDRIVEAL
jgi:hypothetical protein